EMSQGMSQGMSQSQKSWGMSQGKSWGMSQEMSQGMSQGKSQGEPQKPQDGAKAPQLLQSGFNNVDSTIGTLQRLDNCMRRRLFNHDDYWVYCILNLGLNKQGEMELAPKESKKLKGDCKFDAFCL
ncbi:29611_t:CDS:2, partial [Racocetra persica]